MRYLLVPFIVLAVCGLTIAVGTNLSALLAQRILLNHASLLTLAIGVFACSAPMILVLTILYGQRPEPHRQQAAFWRVILSGCPRWLYRASFGLSAYALAFCLFVSALDSWSPPPPRPAARPPAPGALTLAQARNLSAGLTIFYGIMLPILLSVCRRPELLRAPLSPETPPTLQV